MKITADEPVPRREATGNRIHMKWLASLVGLTIAAIGVLGLVAPTVLLDAFRSAQTGLGLYVVAAVRVAFGLFLIGAAAASRLPRTLRVLGVVIIVAGIMTPFVGVERTRAILDWWSAQGTTFMRSWAVIALLLGLFILYAIAPHRTLKRRTAE